MKRPESVRRTAAAGFTIVELLVVVTIIALLIALLVPAVGKARESAMVTQSQSNLRNLAAANATYGAAWNDRQWTICADDVGMYGPTCSEAEYMSATGSCPPSMVLGHGPPSCPPNGQVALWAYWIPCGVTGGGGTTGNPANWYHVWPMVLESQAGAQEGFGAWRMCNVQSFANYVGGRFYDPVFYAPKDKVLLSRADCAISSGYDFAILPDVPTGIVFSSYCFSPAAMWAPSVFARSGFQRPCSESKAAFRSPTVAQASYPDLKTRMIEHNWLQNQHGGEYNTHFTDPEPWTFNQGYTSTPCAMFFDGSVRMAGVASAMNADQQVYSQNLASGESYANPGLWVRGDHISIGPWSEYLGYYTVASFDDQVNTSFHVFTTDGIMGRDFIE